MWVFKRSVWSLITVFFIIFLVVVFVGSSIAMEYYGFINDKLGLDIYKTVDVSEENDDVDTEYYKSDYYYDDGTYNDAEMRANSADVGERTALESTVLLWNDNGALPLDAGSKVGVFGTSAQKSKYRYTGTGSGYISYSGNDDIKQQLEAHNIDVFDALWSIYTAATASYGASMVGAAAAGVSDSNYGEYRIKEPDWSQINAVATSVGLGVAMSSYASYKDAAIMVISRNGGEDYDTNFKNEESFDDCYLDLSKSEGDVLENLSNLKATGKINKIILVINTATPMQVMNIKNYDIDAGLWVGMGGDSSAYQIASAISGSATPSGHLVDTWAYDTDSAPAAENFGDYTFSASPGVPEFFKYTHNNKYVVYQEGIYVGYKYFETRYEDSVINPTSSNAKSDAGVYESGGNSWSYTEEVAFTFGHGLSYTEFTYSGFSALQRADGDWDVSLTIKNSGSTYSGKEVLQVYLQKPYTAHDKQYGIEQASVNLVGFAKTDMLAPGDTQTLTVKVDDYEFKTYDAYKEGTYILEAGDYYLACGTSAHDALNNILALKGYTKANGMDYNGNLNFAKKITVQADDYTKWSVSPYTGNKVVNQFSKADINLYEGTADQKITYLSRKDWKTTYPSDVVMTCTNSKFVADMQYYTGITVDESAALPVYSTVNENYGPLNLLMLKDVSYDNILWESLMNQTTWAEQTMLVTYGAHFFAGAVSVAAPGGLSQNGPSGINQPNPALKTCYIFPCQVNMAATWNALLIEELGRAFGMEMMHVGYEGLNGPGANIHRTPYSGRNWEYFSEDGFISGEMLSAETVGMMEKGAILFAKHMLLNDQERNRYGGCVWANEQSIRDIYCKSYEKACAVTGLNGIMSSFNRLGATWAGRFKGLLDGVLRGEWGFEGAVESDAGVGRHMGTANDTATNAAVIAEALIAGQDFWMLGGSTTILDGYKDNATVAVALREAARRMLFMQLHSTAMNGMKTDTIVIQVTTWWEELLGNLQITSIIILSVCAAMTLASFTIPILKKLGKRKASAA